MKTTPRGPGQNSWQKLMHSHNPNEKRLTFASEDRRLDLDYESDRIWDLSDSTAKKHTATRHRLLGNNLSRNLEHARLELLVEVHLFQLQSIS